MRWWPDTILMRENNEGWSLIYDFFRNKEIKMDANFFAPNVPKTEILEIGLTSHFNWAIPSSLRPCVCLWAEKKYKFGEISRLICSLSRWSAAATDHKVNWHWRTPVAIALQKIVIWHRGRRKRRFCFGSTRWRCTLAEIFLFHFVRGQVSG